MISVGIKILAIWVMFTTRPRPASPLLDVSMANGMTGTRPLRSAPLDHRGNEFGKASYKFSSRLGGFCWSLGYGDTISSSSRWFTVTWSCSNQLMIRDKLITHFPNKMYSTYQHKQWTSNKLNSFAVRDRTLINKIWLQVSNSAPRQNCN